MLLQWESEPEAVANLEIWASSGRAAVSLRIIVRFDANKDLIENWSRYQWADPKFSDWQL